MSMQAVITDGVLVFNPGNYTGHAVVAEVTPKDSNEPTTVTTIQPDEPQLRPGLEETDVSPGLPGFLATFAIAVVVIFILLSMTKKLRRVSHSTGSSHRVTAVFDGEGPVRGPKPGHSVLMGDAEPVQEADSDSAAAGSSDQGNEKS